VAYLQITKSQQSRKWLENSTSPNSIPGTANTTAFFVTYLRKKGMQLACKCFAMSPIPSKFNFENSNTEAKQTVSNVHDFIKGEASEDFGIPILYTTNSQKELLEINFEVSKNELGKKHIG
jgi:hypothetical protein